MQVGRRVFRIRAFPRAAALIPLRAFPRTHLSMSEVDEARLLTADFVSRALLEKPEDTFAFAREHFSTLHGGAALASSARVPTPEADDLRPVVITGPSGVGKGTLIGLLMKEFPDKFGFSVSHTTRAPRPGEVDGEHYHFSDRQAVQKMIDGDEFVESCEVHGNMYGTSVSAVERVRDSGKVCILDIDVQGARKVAANKRAALNARYIFIAPPSVEALHARLKGRGTEDEQTIAMRIKNADEELKAAQDKNFWQAVVVNDDLEESFRSLKRALGL